MRNVYITIKPYVGATDSYGIAAVSSQQASYAPATYGLDIYHPRQIWRTTGGTTDQWVTIDLTQAASNIVLTGVHIGNVNFKECLIYASENGDGSVFDQVSPNILKWNNKPRQTASAGNPESPWATQAGTVTVTPGVVGPNSNLVAQRVVFSATGSVLSQDMAFGTNTEIQSKAYSFSVWTKAATATTLTLSVVSNSVVQSQVITVRNYWTRAEITGTLAGSATSPIQVRIEPVSGAQTVDLWGAQFSFGGMAVTTYETNGLGIVLPKNIRSDRRQAYIDLPFFNQRYLRIVIPGGQTIEDGSSYYSIGSILPLGNTTKFWGGYQFPQSSSISRPSNRLDLDGGGAEYSDFGVPRPTFELSGTWRSTTQENVLHSLITKNRAGTPIHIFRNAALPECPEEIVDVAESYIARLTSEFSSNYSLRELFDQSFSFEEIV